MSSFGVNLFSCDKYRVNCVMFWENLGLVGNVAAISRIFYGIFQCAQCVFSTSEKMIKIKDGLSNSGRGLVAAIPILGTRSICVYDMERMRIKEKEELMQKIDSIIKTIGAGELKNAFQQLDALENDVRDFGILRPYSHELGSRYFNIVTYICSQCYSKERVNQPNYLIASQKLLNKVWNIWGVNYYFSCIEKAASERYSSEKLLCILFDPQSSTRIAISNYLKLALKTATNENRAALQKAFLNAEINRYPRPMKVEDIEIDNANDTSSPW
jgi:hypothetical protein